MKWNTYFSYFFLKAAFESYKTVLANLLSLSLTDILIHSSNILMQFALKQVIKNICFFQLSKKPPLIKADNTWLLEKQYFCLACSKFLSSHQVIDWSCYNFIFFIRINQNFHEKVQFFQKWRNLQKIAKFGVSRQILDKIGVQLCEIFPVWKRF